MISSFSTTPYPQRLQLTKFTSQPHHTPNNSNSPLSPGALEDGDRVNWVKTCDSTDSIIVATKKGYATHFRTDATNLRPTGRTSRGVKTMNLRLGSKCG